jgi:hypothetical protein
LACAQAGRGPVMSLRIVRLTTQSGEVSCRISLNFTSFGRIGKIDAAKDVTHISLAANYNRRDGDTWKSDPHWNRVTLFGELRDRLVNTSSGDLVRNTGQTAQEIAANFCKYATAMQRICLCNSVFRMAGDDALR